MWLAFSEVIKEQLESWSDLAGVPIELAGGAAVPTRRQIEIKPGPSGPRPLAAAHQGTVDLWIDCWEHSIEQDPVVAYRLLALLERQLLEALEHWQRHGERVDDVDFRLEIASRQSDGDIFRPSVGSRTTLRIHWKKME